MNNTDTDHIELKTFLEYLQGFKLFIIHTSLFFARLIKKHWLVVLIPSAVLSAAGVYTYLRVQPVYTVEMQLNYNELHKKTYGEMIDRLQQLLQRGDIEIVAKELNMSKEDTEKLTGIHALNIARSPLQEDVSAEKLPFYIVVSLKDRSITDTLQSGIIQYLRNNPLNIERRRINIANMKERYIFLEQQLAWMDSIKINYNTQLKRGTKSESLTNEIAIEKLFSLSDSLFDEKLQVRSGIESYKSIELIYGFMPSDHPDKPSLTKILMKYAGIGVVISACLLLWLAIPVKREI